jgi:putative ABC transport system permease protein
MKRFLRKLFAPAIKPITGPHPPVFLPLIAEAWISIGTNRVRAMLAMLGIIIGVGSVVLMVAIGSGSQQKVEKAINSLGNNLLIVLNGGKTQKGMRANLAVLLFDTQDFNAIAQLPEVEAVAYSTNPLPQNYISGSLTTFGNGNGVSPEFFAVRNWVFEEGENFSPDDMKLNKRVVVIGASVAEKLFPNQTALGRTISVGDKKTGLMGFLVIGVLQAKGAGLDGRDQDDVVYFPATTFNTYFAPYSNSYMQIFYAKIYPDSDLDEVSDAIKEELRKTQKIPSDTSDNFSVYNLASITKVASDTTAAFSLLLGAIASISLLVGSIGIMNIMLVTVSERTREIGIRKAIGATKQQIMHQFLLEAIMISTVGSVIGLTIGLGGGLAAEYWFGIPVAFSVWTVCMSLVMAGGIGVASGLYPARKAARMQPIEALRTV